MSTDRRWDERRFTIEESAALNGGKRTVFIETMTPGTSVPPHYHTRFSETFDLISGSMTVYKTDQPDLDALENSAMKVEIGKLKTVEPRLYHRYKVGDEMTTLRAIVTPGDLDFERLLKILDGLTRDGEIEKLGNDAVLMAVVFELTDTHLIGPTKEMLDGVYATKSDEVKKRKEELLKKYDTDEALRNLMGTV